MKGIIMNPVNLQTGAALPVGGEVLDWSYYDTQIFSHLTQQYRLFQQALGQGVPAKNLADTNMTQGGAIPQNQRLTAAKVKVWIKVPAIAATESTWSAILDVIYESSIEIIFRNKDSMGTFTLQELFGNAITGILTAGAGFLMPPIARFHGILPLNFPLVLPALQPFEVRWTWFSTPSAYADNFKLRIALNGRLERTV